MIVSEDLLTKLNYGAFGLHLASAIGLITTFLIITKKVEFDTNLWTYKLDSISSDSRNINLEAYDYLHVSTPAIQAILILIFLITAIFHLFYARSNFYKREIAKGFNRVRWLEYAVTSSLMIFLLCILSGVKDFDTVLSLCVINATIMSFGYYLELATDKLSKLLSLGIGFFLLLFIWFVIFRNFYYRIIEAKKLGRDIPIWIYGVLNPMFFWWCSFGFVAAVKYLKEGDFKKYEFYYIILSYLSKAFMGYYLAYGMLREEEPQEE